jgi:hypothetical protein
MNYDWFYIYRHGGTQQRIVKENNVSDALTILLDFSGCMIHVRHRLHTTDETTTLKKCCLKQENASWNTSSFSDQVVDKFYK